MSVGMNELKLNEYGRLKRVALRRPEQAMLSQAKIDAEWKPLNYHTRPDFDVAVAEHKRLVEIIHGVGAEVIYLPAQESLTMDSLYVRDAATLCAKGIILCNMGKPARAAEPGVHGEHFRKAGIPIAGAITGEGKVEGGDIIWEGEWQGRPYRDHGKVLRIEPDRLLEYTHFSPLAGKPDVPENYHTVTIRLAVDIHGTEVTLAQDGNDTEEERRHSEKNWDLMLAGLKEYVEQP